MRHFAQFHDPAIILAGESGQLARAEAGSVWVSAKYVNHMHRRGDGLQPPIVLTWSNSFYDSEGGDYTRPIVRCERSAILHPSGDWAIRRWVSNIAGTVTFAGRLSRGERGKMVSTFALVEGKQIYRRNLSLAIDRLHYSQTLRFNVGIKIDFTVNERNESNFDVTTFTSTITRQEGALPSGVKLPQDDRFQETTSRKP